MARPLKKGFDYFPLDTDFGRDLKVRKIQKACGIATQTLLISLLCTIYKHEGYYMRWDNDVRFLMAEDFGIKESLVDDLIKKAIQVEFFNSDMFNKFQILTSAAIQSRYLEMSKRKPNNKIEDDYELLQHKVTKTPVNVTETQVNEAKTPVNVTKSTQSKVNKTKVNESKQNNNSVIEESTDDNLKSFELWEQLWGFPNAIARTDLTEWIKDLGDELVAFAIEYAGRRNVQSSGANKYLSKVFDGWAQLKVTTVAQAQQAIAEREQRQSNSRSSRPQTVVKETLPEWAEEGYKPKAPEPVEEPELTPELIAEMHRVREIEKKRLEALKNESD